MGDIAFGSREKKDRDSLTDNCYYHIGDKRLAAYLVKYLMYSK